MYISSALVTHVVLVLMVLPKFWHQCCLRFLFRGPTQHWFQNVMSKWYQRNNCKFDVKMTCPKFPHAFNHKPCYLESQNSPCETGNPKVPKKTRNAGTIMTPTNTFLNNHARSYTSCRDLSKFVKRSSVHQACAKADKTQIIL
jgi:hypothetical protein